jgi:hypothetical protein
LVWLRFLVTTRINNEVMSNQDCIISFLDLPIGTAITLDGIPILLQRDDFVAFHQIPGGNFHLVTIQPEISGKDNTPQQAPSSLSRKFRHGFIFHPKNDNWIKVYRYNPHTEEVNENLLDATLVNGLENSIRTMSLAPIRLLPYSSIPKNDDWKFMTLFITSKILQQNQQQQQQHNHPSLCRHDLNHGCKIVPGSLESQDSKHMTNSNDGQEWITPPIPVGLFMSSSHVSSSSSSSSSTLTVSQWHRHPGTRRFLLTFVSPDQRTQFATATDVTIIWNYVMKFFYHNQWEYWLGEFQLAFVLFLYMHCYSSFEYWRDLVSMISFMSLCNVPDVQFWIHFSSTLIRQMKYMDDDLFNDFDLSGDNFFRPAIFRCIHNLEISQDTMLHNIALEMKTEAKRLFSSLAEDDFHNNGYIHGENLEQGIKIDDEDEPTVVSQEEYNSLISTSQLPLQKLEYPKDWRLKYPFLFAAMQPHEDILMVCARALDSKCDVSLVREAADFLEQVVATGAGGEALDGY